MGNDICDAISEKEFNPGVRSLQLFKKISMEKNQVQSEVGQIDFPEDLGHSGISFLNASRGNQVKSSQYTPKSMDGKGKTHMMNDKSDNKDKLDIIEQKVNKLISDLNNENKAKEENRILSTQGNTTSSKQQKSTNETNFLAHQPKKPSNLNSLYLEHLTQHLNPSYTPIPFPFSVIKLILDPILIKHINEEDPNFFTKYKDDETSFKLLRNGCYGNVMGQGYGVFVNVGYYYQGGFMQSEQGKILPCGRGVYVTAKGKYVGEFNVKGQMEGRGKYYQFKLSSSQSNSQDKPLKITQIISQHTDTSNAKSVHNSPQTPPIIYQGLFQQNTLTKGTIQHPLYRYQGSLLNSKPHGFGKLHLLTTDTTYKGEFKQGKFDGKRATYETPQYTYVGDFVKGRKEGYGVLVKKVKGRGAKGYTGNQRQGERFDGYWRADRFMGYSSEDMGQ